LLPRIAERERPRARPTDRHTNMQAVSEREGKREEEREREFMYKYYIISYTRWTDALARFTIILT